MPLLRSSIKSFNSFATNMPLLRSSDQFTECVATNMSLLRSSNMVVSFATYMSLLPSSIRRHAHANLNAFTIKKTSSDFRTRPLMITNDATNT
jgi:hypothetical protein